MAQSITEVMTPDPVTVDAATTIHEAAKLMRDRDIGSLIVCQDGTVHRHRPRHHAARGRRR